MAKLPNQRATALAFAQVQTAVEFIARRSGERSLRRIIDACGRGRSSWEAVQATTGLNKAQFDRQWRAHLAKLNLRLLPGLVPPELRFGKAPQQGAAPRRDQGRPGRGG